MSVVYPGTPELPPPYDPPPQWIPVEERIHNKNYNNDLRMFLPRTVVLKRLKAADTLGFNIRGGKEHNFPFFVSKVMPDSEASRLGILEGDQIVKVNGIDFDTLDHAEAVKVLKFNTTIEMIVRYFPFGSDNRIEVAGEIFDPSHMDRNEFTEQVLKISILSQKAYQK